MLDFFFFFARGNYGSQHVSLLKDTQKAAIPVSREKICLLIAADASIKAF